MSECLLGLFNCEYSAPNYFIRLMCHQIIKEVLNSRETGWRAGGLEGEKLLLIEAIKDRPLFIRELPLRLKTLICCKDGLETNPAKRGKVTHAPQARSEMFRNLYSETNGVS